MPVDGAAADNDHEGLDLTASTAAPLTDDAPSEEALIPTHERRSSRKRVAPPAQQPALEKPSKKPTKKQPKQDGAPHDNNEANNEADDGSVANGEGEDSAPYLAEDEVTAEWRFGAAVSFIEDFWHRIAVQPISFYPNVSPSHNLCLLILLVVLMTGS